MSKEANTKNDKNKLKVRHEPDPNVPEEEYTLYVEKAIVGLLMTEPFFGAILLNVIKRADWTCDTAYVGVSNEAQHIVLGYNPDFMRQLPHEQKMGVFIHEFYHLIFGHITDRAMRNPKYARLWNVAADLAINSLIPRKMLPDFALVPGEAPKNCEDEKLAKLIQSFPKEQASDWYLERLIEFSEENENQDGDGNYTIMIGDDGQTLDGHGSWGEIPEELEEVFRETTKEMIGRAAQQAQTQNWGTVPSVAQQLIEKLLKREIDWKSILKMFVGRVRSSERESTLKKYNKKNGAIGEPDAVWAFPGAKRILHSKLLFAIDQSGSMSDANVQMGLAEGLSASLEGEIDMINFDTEVDEESFRTIKRGKGFKWERTRCGGTDFDCVRRFVTQPKNRGKWQGVVIITDGYAPQMGLAPNVRFLWLITPDGTMDHLRDSDLVVRMSVDKKLKRRSEV